MTLPVSDTLSSGTTQTIQAYSTKWTALIGTISVSNNGLGAFPNASAANSAAIWNADIFPNDQSVQCVLSLSGSAGQFIGPSARASNQGTLTQYALRVNPAGSQWQVIRFFNNNFTNMSGTTAGTFAVNDVLKITAVGNVITAYQNQTVLYTTTDNSASFIAGGSGGLAAFGQGTSSTGPLVNNWQAASLASAVDTLLGQGWV